MPQQCAVSRNHKLGLRQRVTRTASMDLNYVDRREKGPIPMPTTSISGGDCFHED